MRKLTTDNGYTFMIDDMDYLIVSKYHWIGWVSQKRLSDGSLGVPHVYVYAHFYKNNKDSQLLLHRLIMDAPSDRQVDHIDGNGLNNCKSNLRLCTLPQNLMNKCKKPTNTTGYKGVYRHKGTRKWRAQISTNNRAMHLGSFTTKEQAALAYNAAAFKYYGEFAKLNQLTKED